MANNHPRRKPESPDSAWRVQFERAIRALPPSHRPALLTYLRRRQQLNEQELDRQLIEGFRRLPPHLQERAIQLAHDLSYEYTPPPFRIIGADPDY